MPMMKSTQMMGPLQELSVLAKGHSTLTSGHLSTEIIPYKFHVVSPLRNKVPGEIKRARDLEEGGGAGPSS